MGYDVHFYDQTKGVHGKVEVTNRVCGHRYFVKLNNVFANKSVCSVCGPKRRMAIALTHYVEKYGRTYDLTKWEDYRLKVRILTEEVYEKNIDTLNPERLVRGKADWGEDRVNLDHQIPIIYGFKNGLPPELLADVRNLKIIPARKNLSKKQKLTPEAEELLKKLLTA